MSAAHSYGEHSTPALLAQVHQLKRENADLRAENARLRQRQAIERNVFTSQTTSGVKLATWELLRQWERDDLPTDDHGRKAICLETMARHVGISDDTMGKALTTLHELGCADKHTHLDIGPDGLTRKRLAVRLDMEKIRALPSLTRQEVGNKWGGVRCAGCGSHRVRRKTTTEITCLDCGNVSIDVKIQEPKEQPEPPTPGGEPKPQVAGMVEAAAIPVSSVPPNPQKAAILKQESPYPQVAGSVARPQNETLLKQESPPLSDRDALTAAGHLLKSLNMDEPWHIIMTGKVNPKYLPEKAYITSFACISHLEGNQARGLKMRKEASTTRHVSWDVDSTDGYALLKRAAAQLVEVGYHPLLCPSPARGNHAGGGHLWILYDGIVNTQAALAAIFAIAPELHELAELSPLRVNMRLPGGKYVQPGFSAFCKMVSAVNGDVASDNPYQKARMLLAHLTPAAIVPELPEPEPPTPTQPEPRPTLKRSAPVPGQVSFDGKDALAWWNAQHTLDEIHPRANATHALAIWRADTSPSVQYNCEPDGREWWFDYGNVGSCPRSGDAFDLYCLVHGVEKRTFLREVMRQYRAHLLAN